MTALAGELMFTLHIDVIAVRQQLLTTQAYVEINYVYGTSSINTDKVLETTYFPYNLKMTQIDIPIIYICSQYYQQVLR